jgi:hypothetical protein
MTYRVLAIFALALLGCSDGGTSGDAAVDSSTDADAGPATCVADFDCPNVGDHCFFPVDGGCTLQGRQGTCMAFTATPGCTATVACGCDGTTITVCAPDGYVDRPSVSAGACPPMDGGSDAGDDGSSDAAAE